MSHHPWPTAGLVVAATILGGCLGAAPAALEPTEPAAAPPADLAPAAASAADNATATAGNATAALRQEPFAWDGSVSFGSCVPSGPGSCQGPSQTADTFRHVFDGPALAGAMFDLTWEAQPAMEQLRFQLVVEEPCGEGCTSWQPVASAEGPSPLHIETADIAVGDGQVLALRVDTASRTPDPALTFLNLDQPFHVEGTLTFAG